MVCYYDLAEEFFFEKGNVDRMKSLNLVNAFDLPNSCTFIVHEKKRQVNALDLVSTLYNTSKCFGPSLLYAFIAYWGDQPTYESYYQLLYRVGLVDERR